MKGDKFGDIFSVAFYQPPNPKYWISTFHHPAFVIGYDEESGMAIARQGMPLYYPTKTYTPVWQGTEKFYIGRILSYRKSDGVVTNTDRCAIITQQSARNSLSKPLRWREPIIQDDREKGYCQKYADLSQEAIDLVLGYCNERVGKVGYPLSL